MNKALLNKVRAGIALLDRIANATEELNLKRELQDVADGLLEVRQEIEAHIDAAAQLKAALAR
jgi:hypothetical protein